MLDKEIADQLRRVTWCETQTASLRERMESDFDLMSLEPFEIPKEEGEWESFTTNSPATLADSVTNTLSDARLKLWIPVTNEKKRDRDALTMTEQLANGAIWLANQQLCAIPEGIDLQSELCFYAVKRGWTVLRCYLDEMKEHGANKLVVNIAVWDILNTFWMTGAKGAIWNGYRRYASKEQLYEEYGVNSATEDKYGRILVYNVWDNDEEGSFSAGEWIKKPENHGLDHIPVSIRPSGSTPLIQSTNRTDTIKHVGESVISKNRAMYEIESRLHSYALTRASQSAKAPMIVLYDSSISGGKPPEMAEDPWVQGHVIFLDKGKGQELQRFLEQPSNADIIQMQARTAGMISMGGMAPIAYGQINQALPAAAVDMLTDAARQTLKPYKKNVEQQFKWLAEEITKQYKNGNFSEMELEGYDQKGKKFHVEVDPTKIKDNWHFEAELKTNLVRDEIGKMGLAIQAVTNRILSRQTARDKYVDIDDTDLEAQIIDREAAEEETMMRDWQLLDSVLSDDPQNPANILTARAILNRIMMASQPPGMNPSLQATKPSIGGNEVMRGQMQAPPQATAAAQQTVPTTTAERLNAIGLIPGR